MINFYGQTLPVLKANLHTHCTTSDGRFSPDEVIRRYVEHQYDVLAFTDHRKTNPISTYDNGGMTLISGIELHPQGPRGITWHLLGLGVPEYFANCSDEPAQTVVDLINAAGGLVFVAHPYWCGMTSQDVMTLNGVLGIEVYNTSTRYIGKDYNMVIWDEILDAGRNFTALAVDDVHFTGDLFKGWTMIAATDRSPEAIMAAMCAGQFYASQGPEFTRLSFNNGIFEAEFSPCVEAILMSNQCNGFCVSVVDHNGPGTPDKEVASLRVDVSNRPAGSYLRCQLRDRNGNYAWSNPIRL